MSAFEQTYRLTKAVQSGVLTPEQATEVLLRSQSAPAAPLTELLQATGLGEAECRTIAEIPAPVAPAGADLSAATEVVEATGSAPTRATERAEPPTVVESQVGQPPPGTTFVLDDGGGRTLPRGTGPGPNAPDVTVLEHAKDADDAGATQPGLAASPAGAASSGGGRGSAATVALSADEWAQHRDSSATIAAGATPVDPFGAPTVALEGTPAGAPPKPGLGTTVAASARPPGPPAGASQATIGASGGPLLHGKPRYVMRKELARGGLGKIWLSEDQYIARSVAIKELLPSALRSPGLVERFFEEAQVTGQLEHPGIVPIYELGIKPDGSPFYSMKLLGGRTFSEAIKEYHKLDPNDPSRPLALRRLLDVLVDVCNAMAYAHHRGVLHRDLKPVNVMLGDFGEAIVVDWGLAKIIGAPETQAEAAGGADPWQTAVLSGVVRSTVRSEESQTMVGSILGTPAYMSPEQARGQLDQLDARSDVYSLGAMLYELLVGRTPYKGPNPLYVVNLVLEGRLEPPRAVKPDVPPALNAICLKAMAPQPFDRYAGAKDLAEDVARWLADEPVSVYREPLWKRLRRFARRHRTACSSVAAALLAVAVAGSAWLSVERRRIENLRTALTQQLIEGQNAFAQGELEKADDLLGAALARLADEPALAYLRNNAQEVHAQVTAVLDQQAARERARQQFVQFEELYDSALYHGARLSMLDPVRNAEIAMKAISEALAVFGVDGENIAPPKVDERYFTAAERRRILEHCYELVMLRAEAAIRPVSNDAQRKATAKEALRLLERANQLLPGTQAYFLRKALFLFHAGEESAAIAALKTAQQTQPSTAADFFLIGIQQSLEKAYQAAVDSFARALELEPEAFWAKYLTALAFVHLYEEGIVSLSQVDSELVNCRALRPRFWAIDMWMGHVHGLSGDFATAERHFQHAVDLEPEQYAIYVLRGNTRLKKGDLAGAAADFDKAMHIRPDGPEGYDGAAEVKWRRNDRPGALALLEKALASAPGRIEPRLRLARLYEQSGHADRAGAMLTEAIDRWPFEPELFRARARWNVRQRNDKVASLDYRSAIKLRQLASGPEFPRPGSPPANELAQDYAELADLYYTEMGDYQAAAEAAGLALKLRPEFAAASRVRSLALLKLKQHAPAVAALDKYLDGATPNDPLALAQRGHSRAILGDAAGAIADYIRAMKQLADRKELPDAILLARRGWALLNDSAGLALEDFDRAIKQEPKNGELYAGRGYAYVLAGRLAEALADAEEAVRLGAASSDPRAAPTLAFNAACIYAQAVGKVGFAPDDPQRQAQAKEYFDRALALLRLALDKSSGPLRLQHLGLIRQGEPAFDPIRHTPELQRLIAEYSKSP